MSTRMRAARLHSPGEGLIVDTIDRPELRAGDILVRVASCGVIPNMNAIFSGSLWNHLPPLPASVGLDAAGTIAAVGGDVVDFKIGDRVYVNPWLSCGACSYCRAHEPMLCSAAGFQGYFGFFPQSRRVLDAYPIGGFSEYMTAAPNRLVRLPEEVGFDQAARFGYLGTSFAALRAGAVGAGSWVAINGVTGTLGVGATLLALGMGATRILGLGRNRAVLDRVRALAPNRISTLALGERSIAEWLREQTEGLGVDTLIDCSGRGAEASHTADALGGLKRGGVCVNIGALTEKLAIEPIKFMTNRIRFQGSNWFTTGEGQLMAEMARVGVLDLSKLDTEAFPLDGVNEALARVKQRPGGFTNIVVNPGR